MKRRLDNTTVAAVVASIWPVTVEELLGRERRKRVTIPRQAAYWLASRRGGQSTMRLAHFYDRDHKTISEGVRAAERRAAADPDFAAKLYQAGSALVLLGAGVRAEQVIRWASAVSVEARFQTVEGVIR